MKIGISNIAWDVAEDSQISSTLQQFGIDAIDIAPGKYFQDPRAVSNSDIANVRGWWADRGIEITGMQALLFGTSGLNLFGNSRTQKKMLEYLRALCRIGMRLGATRLVFGSPKNRDRSGLTDAQAREVAVSFFNQLGDAAQEHGVIICLEPNPVEYGANFMTNSRDTLTVVEAVGHSAIKMQFDTGAVTMNGECPQAVLEECANSVGHIHISEPNLVPIGDETTDHSMLSKAISSFLPDHTASIEMIATTGEAHCVSIERALTHVLKHYSAIPRHLN